MSVLIVLIPPRARLAARPGVGGPGPELAYVLSAGGRQVTSQGQATPSALPRADSLVAVLADADVAWHRITLPRAPSARLRQALQGVLEDQLLDDEPAIHCALPAKTTAGELTWVAVVHRPWLSATLAQLEQAGRIVDRVVPIGTPGSDPGSGHFFVAHDSELADARHCLCLSDGQGLAVLPLAGALPRQRWLADPAQALHWTASPAAAAGAEAWLGQPVHVLTDAERALQAIQGDWNLRQFDLAPRRRGSRALRDARLALFSPAWRPVRLGLIGLIALHLIGLNVWAHQQRRQIVDQRLAMVDLLKSTHPQIRAVLDAPLQMTRETDALRMAAGLPGDNDFENLLAVAASAWAEANGPVAGIRFEGGALSIAVPDWDAARIESFRAGLQGQGWAVKASDGWLTLARQVRAQP